MFGPALLNEARFGRYHAGWRHVSGDSRSTRWTSASATASTRADRAAADDRRRRAQLRRPGRAAAGTQRHARTSSTTRVTRASRTPHRSSSAASTGASSTTTSPKGTGVFNFPSVAAFLAGTANAFSITLGERRSRIDQDAPSASSSRTRSPSATALTLDLGLRYEWHVTPTERDNQFVVFDAATRVARARRRRRRRDLSRRTTRTSSRALGVAWTPPPTAARWCAPPTARAVDEPGTTAVRDTAGNPPFAIPLTATGLDSAGERGRRRRSPSAWRRPPSIRNFRNASLRSWNVNLQRQLAGQMAATVGYFGSRGTRPAHLAQHQPAGERRAPVPRALGVEPDPARHRARQHHAGGEQRLFELPRRSGSSATKRLSRGLQFDASYTWSKSLDTNSLNSSGFAVQNGYDIANQYGLSDFDARHRFVVQRDLRAAVHRARAGRAAGRSPRSSSRRAAIRSTSSPATASLNGVPNTVRPDLVGSGSTSSARSDQWFDPSAFAAVNRFGNLGRNVVIGPAFHNTDLSISQERCASARTRAAAAARSTCSTCSTIPTSARRATSSAARRSARSRRTRLPTGEAGSSRQIQLAVRAVVLAWRVTACGGCSRPRPRLSRPSSCAGPPTRRSRRAGPC